MRKIGNVFRSRRRSTTYVSFTLKHGTPRKEYFYTHASSHISNMKPTAAEIEAALAYYRKVPAERYKYLLEIYIDVIPKAEFVDELIREETSDED